MMNIGPPCAEKDSHASEMLMMINEYGFNNTINSNPRAGPPPQDLRNITVRNQIINENPANNRVYTFNDTAYGYTWKEEIR
jgi:hypothetical protein